MICVGSSCAAYQFSPIPLVPPVTNAVFDSNLQKLGDGGGETENSFAIVYTIASEISK